MIFEFTHTENSRELTEKLEMWIIFWRVSLKKIRSIPDLLYITFKTAEKSPIPRTCIHRHRMLMNYSDNKNF